MSSILRSRQVGKLDLSLLLNDGMKLIVNACFVFYLASVLLIPASLFAATDVEVGESELRVEVQPFGANLFTGNFLKSRGNGLNPEYIVAPGDRVVVNVWGVLTLTDVFEVDSQGNIFLPDIGPLKLAGVKNKDLTKTVKWHISQVYTDNFDVYTILETAQPISIYVTGMVENPGRYAGLASDSVLYYLDLSGGIDSQLGSFRNIEIIRKGESIASIDLYDFLLKGTIEAPQLEENDTILARPRGSFVLLEGNVARSKYIEIKNKTAKGRELLSVIPKSAQATEVTLQGMRNGVPITHTLSVNEFLGLTVEDGDVVTLRDDGRSDTIIVKVNGEFLGPSEISVNRGARLVDVLNYIPVDPDLADVKSIYLRRVSVAQAQKDAINDSLFRLERSSLLALSGSEREANIRVQEAKLMESFAERARQIDPLGRVVTTQNGVQQNILLEPGDIIVIPPKTQVVRIAGEVKMMHAVTFRPGWTAADYINQAGGYSDRANEDEVIVHHQNAEVVISEPNVVIQPGDEIIVPPRVDSKWRQFALDMMDVIYKIAIAAQIAINL